MRIALISEHASPLADVGSVDAGGQNVYVNEVARNLTGMGHTVDVFTRRDDPSQPEVVEVSPGLRVIHVPAGPPGHVPKEQLLQHMPSFSEWMEDWIGTTRYDIAHANFFMSGLVARDLRRRTGLPYVVTFHALGAVRTQHQGAADGFPAERVAMEQSVIDDAARVIAECPQDEADLIRWYDVSSSRLVTIPCGVDVDVFRPVGNVFARARRGWDEDAWIVLHVGRMVPRKGVDNTIRAVADLRRRGVDDAKLIIVGGRSERAEDDPEVRRLMEVAAEEGVSDHVHFEGRVDHDRLPLYYGAADVFVTTPWYEPFGITPLEAMACGLPVVGSNVGGIKYTVRDGETGFLVPPRDPAAVADRLEELHRHPRVAATLSTNARRRTRDLFTWPKVTAALSDLYTDVLNGTDKRERESDLASSYRFALAELSGVLDHLDGLDTDLQRAATVMVGCLQQGGKVLVAGNGGSAAQAQHLAAELVGRFLIEDRPALPVISLTADTAVITAWANDVGFDDVFARQVEAFARPGDVLVGMSTSGQSENLVRAYEAARRRSVQTVSLLGGDGGVLGGMSDVAVVVPSRNTQRIQEVHVLLVHVLSSLVESGMAVGGARPLAVDISQPPATSLTMGTRA